MRKRISLKKKLSICINLIIFSLFSTYDESIQNLKKAIDLDFDQVNLGETFRIAFESYELDNIFDMSVQDKSMLRSYLVDRVKTELCKLDRDFKNREMDEVQREGAKIFINHTRNTIDELLS